MRIPSRSLSIAVMTVLVMGLHAQAEEAIYRITHSLTVKEIPAGSHRVRVWFWLPDEDDCQRLLDLNVTEAPADYRITRDSNYGHRYLYAEVTDPANSTVRLVTDFLIRRQSVSVPVNAAEAAPLTDAHRTEFSEYLRRDVPNMQVNDQIISLADDICGKESNEVKEARLLFNWVTDHTDHYSKSGAPKSSGMGSADYCLASKGGGCTDQHSLFIALARARGIPTRLQFGTLLKPANEGKEMDPGYRCWVQYFVPNFGWVPMDISAANTNPSRRDFYFSGLDDRRIHFSEGRDLDLTPKQDGPRLNLFINGYAEVDGRPHKALQRTLKYIEVKPPLQQSSTR